MTNSKPSRLFAVIGLSDWSRSWASLVSAAQLSAMMLVGNDLGCVDAGIERILAVPQGLVPDALMPWIDHRAELEVLP